jgi:hypothetical protein
MTINTWNGEDHTLIQFWSHKRSGERVGVLMTREGRVLATTDLLTQREAIPENVPHLEFDHHHWWDDGQRIDPDEWDLYDPR